MGKGHDITHSLHRHGLSGSLRGEFIVLSFGDTYFLAKYRARLRRALPRAYAIVERLALRLGTLRLLHAFRRLRPKGEPEYDNVINSYEELRTYLQRVKETNIRKSVAKSVIVSGVFEEVDRCLKEVGLCPHTKHFSLGVFGRTDLLPTDEVLEVTTMCGHHMISPRLVKVLVDDVAKGRATPGEAAHIMCKLCSCGIFNEPRAAMITADLAK